MQSLCDLADRLSRFLYLAARNLMTVLGYSLSHSDCLGHSALNVSVAAMASII